MDIRIKQAFTDIWRLYQENYDIAADDSDRWDDLLRSAAEIYRRNKDHTVVMNFLLVILEDLDSRSKTHEEKIMKGRIIRLEEVERRPEPPVRRKTPEEDRCRTAPEGVQSSLIQSMGDAGTMSVDGKDHG